MGPTASGKTDLAVDLVERLPCDIVSVDSALVYRGMDIGTAKPGQEVLQRAPHRLIDICDPAEAYSVARFRTDALREMSDIVRLGRTPLLVGGTMLYFRALQQGLSSLPSADADLRARLEQQGQRLGWREMHRRLARVDPEAAGRIHPNDPQRIQRALEVHAITGRPMTLLLEEGRQQARLPYRLIKLVRAPKDRAILHARIDARFRRMLDEGFDDEVRRLFEGRDLTPKLPSMRAVGYRQMLKFLQGEYTYEEMVQRGIIATRQLAKRQYTWLRTEAGCRWLFDDEAPLDQALFLLNESLREC